jgi:signal transduction histidine kinase
MLFKKSIKWELTVVYILLIGILFGSIAIFNQFYLENQFIGERVETLEKTYSALNTFIEESKSKNIDFKDFLRSNRNNNNQGLDTERRTNADNAFVRFLVGIQDTYNVNISLVDSDNIVYNLRGSFGSSTRILSLIFNDFEETEETKLLKKSENYTIVISRQSLIDRYRFASGAERNSNVQERGPANYSNANINSRQLPPSRDRQRRLECFGVLSDGETFFYMESPVEAIKEATTFFNGLLLKVFIIAIIVGSIVVYLISAKISKPIKDLANVSKKMTELDFSAKYDNKYNRNDEIGILGDSMNDLSSKLEDTIENLKDANAKLTEDIHRKEKLDIMRQEFVANVSHELKTPIAIISGYAEGLVSGIAETKEDRDYYCEVIMDETGKMNKIVRQLLNLSSIEKGNEEIELEDINLANLVSGLINSLGAMTKEKDLNIKVDIDSDITIKSDELKADEVIRNYLTNAINHVDENKLIKVYTENMTGNKIRLCVYNSGTTLSDENLKLIWEKFYKVDKAHTRSYGGSGLGLSIVKSISIQLGTECGAYNIVGNKDLKDGICFYFDFTKSI